MNDRPTSHGSWRRTQGVLLAAGLVSMLWTAAVGAEGSNEPAGFERYSVEATARGITLTLDRANFLPISPAFRLSAPQVTAKLDDSPSSAARSAPVDPGVLASARGLSQIFGAPPKLVPRYPLYADAAFPAGPPSAKVNKDSAVLSGESAAGPDAASATASLGGGPNRQARSGAAFSLPVPAALQPRVDALRQAVATALSLRSTGAGSPDLISVASGESSVALRHVGGRLVQQARSQLDDVSLLGGVIHIESVVSTLDFELPAKPGSKPTTTTALTGVKIADQPVELTGTGFRLSQHSIQLPAGALGELNEAFSSHGFTFAVGQRDADAESASTTALVMGFTGSVQPGETDTGELALGFARLGYIIETGGAEAARLAGLPAGPDWVAAPRRVTAQSQRCCS